MIYFLMLTLLVAAPLLPAGAQHDHGQQKPPTGSSYAGFVNRDVKALSDLDIKALLAGEGMGMALAAELNRYPGPKHAVELAHDLELEHSQVKQLSVIQDSMMVEARAIGARIVDAERRLDRAFRDRTVSDQTLRNLTAEIAELAGSLRYVHLRAHLAVARQLTDRQIERYVVLRGYAAKAEK